MPSNNDEWACGNEMQVLTFSHRSQLSMQGQHNGNCIGSGLRISINVPISMN